MIPIGDDNTERTRTPFMNYIFLAINILVFIYYQNWGTDISVILSYATVPMEIISGTDIQTEGGLGITPIPVHLTLFSAMFMHGSIAHIFGNMMYLLVFGDNLENRMGHARYAFFYILCGLLASITHVTLANYTGKDLLIPSLGASGAISGVLGGYLMLFPKNSVSLLVFITVIRVPAFISLGLWIVLQLFSGYGSLSDPAGGGGVAYAAHIGGFFAGLILVHFFVKKKTLTDSRRTFPEL
jgi:membrane associated rhomboid family serine protease